MPAACSCDTTACRVWPTHPHHTLPHLLNHAGGAGEQQWSTQPANVKGDVLILDVGSLMFQVSLRHTFNCCDLHVKSLGPSNSLTSPQSLMRTSLVLHLCSVCPLSSLITPLTTTQHPSTQTHTNRATTPCPRPFSSRRAVQMLAHAQLGATHGRFATGRKGVAAAAGPTQRRTLQVGVCVE